MVNKVYNFEFLNQICQKNVFAVQNRANEKLSLNSAYLN